MSQNFKKTKTTSPHDMNKLNGIENVGKFDFKSAKSMKNSNWKCSTLKMSELGNALPESKVLN